MARPYAGMVLSWPSSDRYEREGIHVGWIHSLGIEARHQAHQPSGILVTSAILEKSRQGPLSATESRGPVFLSTALHTGVSIHLSLATAYIIKPDLSVFDLPEARFNICKWPRRVRALTGGPEAESSPGVRNFSGRPWPHHRSTQRHTTATTVRLSLLARLDFTS